MAKQYRVCITGGHLTPALAVIDEIKKRALPWQIIFVGRTYALEGSRAHSQEYEEMHKRNILFLSLLAGRVSRVLTPWSLVSWIKIPLGLVQAFWYIAKHHPSLVLSFGGYVALPIAVASWFLGIPVITHEQTMRMGLANRIIAMLAKKVLVSFPETTNVSNTSKVVVTGPPIRDELFYAPRKPSFSVVEGIPIIYVTGGSTGAVTLNERIYPIIDRLLPAWLIIHQTGNSFRFGDENIFKKQLSKKYRSRYVVKPYFDVSDVAWIYKHADLVIGRCGANTIWELAVLGKTALLVPLPWSAGQEQMANAQWLASRGSAMVLSQPDASANVLLNTIDMMWKKREAHRAAAIRLQKSFITNGAANVVDTLLTQDVA